MSEREWASFWWGEWNDSLDEMFTDGSRILWTYHLERVPSYVTTEDASILVSRDQVYGHSHLQGFANRFRYIMIQETGLGWLDCDGHVLGEIPDGPYLCGGLGHRFGTWLLRWPPSEEGQRIGRALIAGEEQLRNLFYGSTGGWLFSEVRHETRHLWEAVGQDVFEHVPDCQPAIVDGMVSGCMDPRELTSTQPGRLPTLQLKRNGDDLGDRGGVDE